MLSTLRVYSLHVLVFTKGKSLHYFSWEVICIVYKRNIYKFIFFTYVKQTTCNIFAFIYTYIWYINAEIYAFFAYVQLVSHTHTYIL